MTIGVFDSGLGGLSITRSIRELMPGHDIYYAGDTLYVPWGGRGAEWIAHRSRAMAEFLLEQGAQAIVVACNSATAHSVNQLRQTFSVPVVGVEPPIKPAGLASHDSILVLATEATLESERFNHLQALYCGNQRVYLRPSPDLVELVEAGLGNATLVESVLADVLSPYLQKGVSAIVLGCTHFSWLRQVIHKLAGISVTVYDPAQAVALQVQRMLGSNSQAGNSGNGALRLCFTAVSAQADTTLESLKLGPYEKTRVNIQGSSLQSTG